jgi:hypothetical protein
MRLSLYPFHRLMSVVSLSSPRALLLQWSAAAANEGCGPPPPGAEGESPSPLLLHGGRALRPPRPNLCHRSALHRRLRGSSLLASASTVPKAPHGRSPPLLSTVVQAWADLRSPPEEGLLSQPLLSSRAEVVEGNALGAQHR